MIDLTGKSVLVVGAGISGIGSATLLEEKGYSFRLCRFRVERTQGPLGKPAVRKIIAIPLRAYANGVE